MLLLLEAASRLLLEAAPRLLLEAAPRLLLEAAPRLLLEAAPRLLLEAGTGLLLRRLLENRLRETARGRRWLRERLMRLPGVLKRGRVLRLVRGVPVLKLWRGRGAHAGLPERVQFVRHD